MTMKDIADLRINQMEDLLLGMSENAEKIEAELKGKGGKQRLEGMDALKEFAKISKSK